MDLHTLQYPPLLMVWRSIAGANKEKFDFALVDIAVFNEFIAFKQRPTIAELLAEFREIQAEELVELDLPDRQDRPNPLLENY